MELKTGRLSNKEKQKLQEWHKTSSLEEMAKRLNRRIESVQDWFEKYVPKVKLIPENEQLLNTLHDKVYWKALQKQFSADELRTFEAHWINFIQQFNNDIEYSEELQLVDLLKIDLLINRNLEERNKAKREIEILQGKLDEFIEKCGYPPYMDGEVQDIGKMNEYTTLAQSVKMCEASYNGRTNEFATLSNKKDAYTEELKATRKQRIEILKNVKKDFVSLIKSLMDEKTREQEGKELSLMNAAAQKEMERLSQVHIYQDGQGDLPILNDKTFKAYVEKQEE